MLPATSKRKYWLNIFSYTLHFETFLKLDDFLVVFVLQLLHEIAKLLHQPILQDNYFSSSVFLNLRCSS